MPKEIRSFMEEGYLGYVDIKTIDENVEVARKIGYNIVGSFVIPKKSWWDDYYAVIEAKMPLLKATHQEMRVLCGLSHMKRQKSPCSANIQTIKAMYSVFYKTPNKIQP